MQNLELRINNATLEGTDEGMRVSGYVNKTNQWSQTLGLRKKFVERILPGAFNKALQNQNEIHFLAEHDNAKILSSTRNGSLTLREDKNGLYMQATISDTSWGRDYHTLIKDGIIKNMSFGMQVLKDSWKQLNDGTYERSISDLALFEVSAVRSPAYVQSEIHTSRSKDFIEEPTITNLEEDTMSVNLDQYRAKLAQFDNVTKTAVAEALDEKEKAIRGFEQFLRRENGEELRAMTTSTGSIMIPTHLFNEVILKATEVAPLFGKTRNFTPNNGNLEVLAEENMGAAATFVGENVSINPEDFTLRKVLLTAKRVGTAIEISEQTINDSGINITEYAKGLLSRRLGQTVEESILFGQKATQFEGILVDSPENKIEVVTNASLASIDMDKLIDFYNKLHPQYLNEAVWVVSRKAFNRISKLKDNNGNYYLQRNTGVDKVSNELMGHQFLVSEAMDNLELNTANKHIVLANFFEGYTTMTRRNLRLRHITDDTTQALRGSELLLLDGYADGKILNSDALKIMKFTTV